MEKELLEYLGTGRRKRAVVSIRMRPGTGKIDVNKRVFEKYFATELQRNAILAPLVLTDRMGKYDLIMRIKGGGIEAQVEAARLGIARALVQQDETLRADLKGKGYLRRDPRRRERKKYGLAGARKSFQFSKR